jgi:hypothetical protein
MMCWWVHCFTLAQNVPKEHLAENCIKLRHSQRNDGVAVSFLLFILWSMSPIDIIVFILVFVPFPFGSVLVFSLRSQIPLLFVTQVETLPDRYLTYLLARGRLHV